MFQMIEFNQGAPKRIQYFMKVYEFAHLIAVSENVEGQTIETLETAAILHEIGIHPGEEKMHYEIMNHFSCHKIMILGGNNNDNK